MPHIAYRLTQMRYQQEALSGYGAMRFDGRWHKRGVPMVYAAESPALALLETLVHVERAELMVREYVTLRVEFEDKHLSRIATLPDDWRAWPWPTSTQQLGTAWMQAEASVVLKVPSAIVPAQKNYLINPTHPEFEELDVSAPEPFPVDSRLA